MILHNEIRFASGICDNLAAHGWHYAGGDHSDLLQERRTALISAAVTGQIDVRRLTA